MGGQAWTLKTKLLQATFLSGSVAVGAVLGVAPAHAQQVCTIAGSSVTCLILAQGQVQVAAPGANGANSDNTNDEGGTGGTGGTVGLSSTNPLAGALSATSYGGSGGAGYTASDFESASRGGNGGNGGAVTINSSSALTVPAPPPVAAGYSGIFGAADGGSGGVGGGASAFNGAQPGGGGGDGGRVTIVSSGDITVNAAGSAIYGSARGGTGGYGGLAQSNVTSDSGRSGDGGDGGLVQITNRGVILTSSAQSAAIVANGDGGQGGNGAGESEALATDASPGNGGNGAGAGGIGANGVVQGQAVSAQQAAVVVNNYAGITATAGAAGIVASAKGGQGGYAGGQTAASGGTGGNGGLVYVGNAAGILVTGDNAFGIAALATGGAGGAGGVGRGSGGAGGDGGTGGIATVVNGHGITVSTDGTDAFGVYAQANGGVGGQAGTNDRAASVPGAGGNAGTAFITQAGTIKTSGASAHGVYAAAVGGAGGQVPEAPAPDIGLVPVGRGGNGGTANATVNIAGGTITTSGTGADGVLVNASGGVGGASGNGGAGGTAGAATLQSGGTILVSGDTANGIAVLAQGGAGGDALTDVEGDLGIGGVGGKGGTISVTNSAAITAQGANAVGLLLDSSGGTGGASNPLTNIPTGPAWSDVRPDAGNVTLVNTGSVTLTNSVGGTGIEVLANGGAACQDPLSLTCGPFGGGNGGAITATINNSVATAYAVQVVSSGNLLAPAIVLSANGGDAGSGSTLSQFAPIGTGGDAGSVSLFVSPVSNASTISISTLAVNSPAILVTANGGAGGAGGVPGAPSFASFGSDGVGGNAGAVTIDISSGAVAISTANDQSAGISASSVGGNGGGFSAQSPGTPSLTNGAAGGAAGMVVVQNAASITTAGASSPAIEAISAGGAGSEGAIGGAGGTGVVSGSGGIELTAVAVNNIGALTTTGANAYGIMVSSTGGNGANSTGSGVAGGAGAPGGDVSVVNGGTIITQGDSSHAIAAMTVGGGGGAGGDFESGDHLFVVATGGIGGSGANAGDTDVTNSAAILTYLDSSSGLFAFSVGGGGGNGGSASATGVGGFAVPSFAVTIGGAGGSGAKGGDITLTNNVGGDIFTAGADSPTIHALTIGGAGGAGGSASATTYSAGFGDLPNIDMTFAIAGDGGTGGQGGNLTLTNAGNLTALGDQSPGVLAVSVGGGGGAGGNADAQSVAYGVALDVSLSVSIGGSGGAGGGGGDVTVNNQNARSSIFTYGFASDGIMAVSIGGGGGNGGIGTSDVETAMVAQTYVNTLPLSFNESWSASMAIGGDGGQGGTGGDVTIANDGIIATFGADSQGIFAQSVGGSGGNAAAGKTTASQERNFMLAVGGTGGSGGDGGVVTVTNGSESLISTASDGAHAIFAQSIGGGGGTGGTATADASGGAFEELTDNLTKMVSAKILSIYIDDQDWLQKSTFEPSVTVNIALGGSGGAGGNGGDITVINSGAIATGAAGGNGGDVAFGIFAQSIGGGGGAGGGATSMGTRMLNAQETLGGSGGAFGYGGTVVVTSTGPITTTGDSAFGVLAESIGGGGGVAGIATDLSQIELGVNIAVGGGLAEQANSGGGTVQVSVADITTRGVESHAVVAQSIGGGGGLFFFNPADYTNAGQADYQQELGEAVTNAVGAAQLAAIAEQFAIDSANSTATITLNFGGTGSSSINSAGGGGAVDLTLNGAVATSGTAAFGVLAQSIGGGGGFATDGTGVDVNQTTVQGRLGMPVDGSGPGFGSAPVAGGTVSLTLEAGGSIQTTGIGATGVVAQSIGGGGGYTGALDAIGASYATFLPQVNGPEQVFIGEIQGGDVTIVSDGNFNITTTGANAHGIVAQSVSGGGGLVGNSDGLILPDASAANTSRANYFGTTAGAVTIDYTGTMSTTGVGSVAIFAQNGFQGTSGAIDRLQPVSQPSGPISINIGPNSTVIGGSTLPVAGAPQITGTTTGAGIVMDGGGANTVTIQDGAYLSAVSGLAASSLWGSNVLTNYGTVSGDLQWVNSPVSAGGNGPSSVLNMQGGTYRSNVSGNGILNLGGTGTFNNSGTFDIAGVGTIGTATLVGQYQMNNGTVLVDVDGASSSDRLAMTSVAGMTGTLAVHVMNTLDPTAAYTVMSLTSEQNADLPMSQAAAALSATTPTSNGVNVYWGLTADADTLTLRPGLDFVNGANGLTPNETAYARYLQATWDAGGSARMNEVYADLVNLPSAAAYRTALQTSVPTVMMAAPLSSVLAARTAMTSVMSCPEFQGSGTLLVQEECAWARVDANSTRYTPNDATGFTLDSVTYRLGAQKEIASGWFAGVAADVMVGSFDLEYGTANADGQSIGLSASLKHEMGPWLLSAAARFGYGWFDADRLSIIGQDAYLSSSSYQVLSTSARLRAEYEIPFDTWYLKPSGQLDLLYASVPGFTEGGNGSAYDLSVRQSDGFTVALTPYVEMGARLDLPDGSTLRPYGTAGLTWYSESSWTMDASLVNAPANAGLFSVTSSLPELLGNLGVGLQWSSKTGSQLRLNYEADFASDYLSQTGMVRFSMRF